MSEGNETKPSAPELTALAPTEKNQRNRRNLAIAISLGVFVVLVFAVTILRLGGAVAQ